MNNLIKERLNVIKELILKKGFNQIEIVEKSINISIGRREVDYLFNGLLQIRLGDYVGDGFEFRFIENVSNDSIISATYKVSFINDKQKIHRYDYSQKRGFHYHIEFMNKKIERAHIPLPHININSFVDYVIEQSLEHFH